MVILFYIFWTLFKTYPIILQDYRQENNHNIMNFFKEQLMIRQTRELQAVVLPENVQGLSITNRDELDVIGQNTNEMVIFSFF